MQTPPAIDKAITIWKQQGGTLRTSKALKLGIHPRTLYTMRDSGMLSRLSRGLYRLTDSPPSSDPDLTTVALQIPKAVICLVSALAFHELTTQIPETVDIAIHHKARPPTLDYPPIRLFWFSGLAFQKGFQTHTIDGIPVRIYGPAKSIADTFKYRNQIGMDIALEALKLYRQHRDFNVKELLHYARICRVSKLMRLYLEILL
jgi:predicted transcriptional regulator of viral defense system